MQFGAVVEDGNGMILILLLDVLNFCLLSFSRFNVRENAKERTILMVKHVASPCFIFPGSKKISDVCRFASNGRDDKRCLCCKYFLY